MKRYSKRVREEAALICAIAASGGVYAERDRRVHSYSDIFRALGSPTVGSLGLAIRAYVEASDEMGGTWTREVDVEAEGLIRRGWSP